jgi:hypothetical protein
MNAANTGITWLKVEKDITGVTASVVRSLDDMVAPFAGFPVVWDPEHRLVGWDMGRCYVSVVVLVGRH